MYNLSMLGSLLGMYRICTRTGGEVVKNRVGWIHAVNVGKGEITSHHLLPEEEQPLPKGKQSANRFGQNDK
jgi:hypothetical protein